MPTPAPTRRGPLARAGAPARRTVGLVVGALLVLGAVLTACGGSGPTRASFVSKANVQCDSFNHRLDGKTQPRTTRQGIDYALNYYTDLDLMISTLNEMSLPSADAQRIRDRWLHPAQRSLAGFQRNLRLIRRASVANDSATVRRELRLLAHVGSQGVDTDYLRTLGVTKCMPVFGTPA